MTKKRTKKVQFEEEISPLILQLRAACNVAGIPMFLSCVIPEEDGSQERHINEMISPAVVNCTLKNDKIAEYVKVFNGFHTVPSIDTMEVELG